MIVSLFLGVLKNNWQLCLALILGAVGLLAWESEHVLLLHTRTELAADAGLLREAQDLAKTQDAKAAAAAQQQKAQSDVLSAQLASALKAHALTGAALTASIVRYENDRSARQVCPGASGAGQRDGPGPSQQSPSGHRSTAEVLAETPAACSAVIDQLRTAQAILKSLSAP